MTSCNNNTLWASVMMLNIVILMMVLSDLGETLSEKEFAPNPVIMELTKWIFESMAYYLDKPFELFVNPIFLIFLALSIGLMFRGIYIITNEFQFIKINDPKDKNEVLE